MQWSGGRLLWKELQVEIFSVNAIDTIEPSTAPTVQMRQLVESEKLFYKKILKKEQYKET